ncbi:MAG TPA: helix-turn-helix transcriptional regulator [Actinomycetes bacterium]
MATADQRENFARALGRARAECGLSQRELAAALGVSQASVSQWLTGQSAPKPERIAGLERVLRLAPNALARHLGPAPSDQQDQKSVMTVAEAAEADPRLGEREQRILNAVYRELVHQRAAEQRDGEQATTG